MKMLQLLHFQREKVPARCVISIKLAKKLAMFDDAKCHQGSLYALWGTVERWLQRSGYDVIIKR